MRHHYTSNTKATIQKNNKCWPDVEHLEMLYYNNCSFYYSYHNYSYYYCSNYYNNCSFLQNSIQGIGSAGQVLVAHKLNSLLACGIFPEQGSNPCPLHWQVNSTTGPPGKSQKFLKFSFYKIFISLLTFFFMKLHQIIQLPNIIFTS